ncbi:MAG: hypothetical protein M1818_000019 [Claussenomyces sp. TS43310]|nr:MAG: hypothetical protein M1818_000019 [Claussenomyces sp. TS43310]
MKIFLATAFAALAAAAPASYNRNLTSLTDAPYGDKKGLAYNNGDITTVLSQSGSATWAYNWGTALNAPLFQQITMYWGPGSQGDAAGVTAAINAGDSPWVLGYNEPDETSANGGCNASPQAAYDAWGDDMFQFVNLGAKLVCPAITSDDTTDGATGGPSGLTWLSDFASIGNNPSQFQCSAQALHWYGVDGDDGATQAQLFISYIESANTRVNDIFGTSMPLWITEFSSLPVHDVDILSDFLAVAIPWLDAQDYVDRYSPFQAEDLVDGSSLTVAGQTFVSTS